MIPFIANKQPNIGSIEKYLAASSLENQWSNFGPLTRTLEQRLEKITGQHVVVCASGTAALWAAMLLQEHLAGRKLHWAMSSFSFPCVPPALFDVEFLDCDENGLLPESDHEAIVATNLFGGFDKQYYNKIVVVDAAMAFGSRGVFEMTSLHHTKPWGFGEGGFLTVPEEHRLAVRSITNFGRMTSTHKYHSFNGKISELSCAGILQHLDRDLSGYRQQYERIKAVALNLGLSVLGSPQGIPPNVPIRFPRPIQIENEIIKLAKLYEPIQDTPNAARLYSQIVIFPCHPEVTLDDNEIKQVLIGL